MFKINKFKKCEKGGAVFRAPDSLKILFLVSRRSKSYIQGLFP